MRQLTANTVKTAVNTWRPSSFSMGGAGLAVMCAAFDEVLPGQGWDHAGHALLADGVEYVTASLGDHSLFTGAVGFAAAVWMSSRSGERYHGLLRQLDDLLLPRMRAQAEAPAIGPGVYDVVNGLSGWAGFLCCRASSPEVFSVARAVALALADVLREGGLRRMIRNASDGLVVDCGVAHGVAGLLAALSLLESHFRFASLRIESGIRWAGNWLVERAAAVGECILWPDAVALQPAEHGGGGSLPVHAGSWCHGSSGIVRALYLAGEAVDEPGFRGLAVEAMRSHCEKEPELRSPSVCHGLAGQLLLTLAFAKDTNDAIFVQAGKSMTQQLYERYRANCPLGFREVEGEGLTEVDHPGLLRGAAGTALGLLAGHIEQPPQWGRLLLLS
ncbi:lanthionine synthetase LanC family protein [Nonomuraea sp. KM90]